MVVQALQQQLEVLVRVEDVAAARLLQNSSQALGWMCVRACVRMCLMVHAGGEGAGIRLCFGPEYFPTLRVRQ